PDRTGWPKRSSPGRVHSTPKAKYASCAGLRLQLNKLPDLGQCLELGGLLLVGPLRTVPVDVDEAEEAERLIRGGAELVPGHAGHVDEIVARDVVDRVANEALPAPANDHDRVDVIVPLQRRVPARLDLEVAQLGGELRPTLEKHLPRDRLEM